VAAEATGIELCRAADPLQDVPPARVHRSGFRGGASGPFLASTLARFSDAEEAEEFMAAVDDAFDACRRYDVDGAPYELQPVTIRDLGDEALGARVSGSIDAGAVRGPLLYARAGRSVVAVALLGVGSAPDDAVARGAVEAVLARL
jgi:hypothetical protein